MGGLSMLLEAELGQNLIEKLLKFDVVFCVGKYIPPIKNERRENIGPRDFGFCHPPSVS